MKFFVVALSGSLLSACVAEPKALLPHPGIWKEVERKGEPVRAREFGLVRVLVAEPVFQKDTVMIRMWIENRSNDLIIFESKDMQLIEPGGHACRNEAKEEKRELSGVGDELAVGEFALNHATRCRDEGFTVRFRVTPYAPTAGAPFPLEFSFSRD